MRVEDGHIYWIDRDEVVPFSPERLGDAGDVAVVPHDLMATLAACRRAVAALASGGRRPVVVGGDDSVVFPAVAGIHDVTDGSVAVVHLDAHLDLLDHSDAQGAHSQSSGLRRALELERVDPTASVKVGTRNFNFPSSKRFIDEAGLTEIPASEVHRVGAAAVVDRVVATAAAADHMVVALDIDVLDPAHAPGVGWHEPGGLTTRQLLDILVALAPIADGLVVNEVNPMTDHGSQTSILAANLIFQFVVAGVSAGR